MDHTKILQVLQWFLEMISGSGVYWYLEGRANLLVQGIPVTCADIDITTTKEGYEKIKSLMALPFTELHEPHKMKHALHYNIAGVDLEIAWYYDTHKPFCTAVQVLSWNGLQLHTAPLLHAIAFYEYIGKHDRAELIRKHLQSPL